jgi:N-acetylglucosaminyl-diphospho-decaprenol L-rhamnosyltransferase
MAGVAAVVLNFRTPEKTVACLRSLVEEGITRIVLVENSEDAGASLSAMREGLAILRDDGATIDVLDQGRNLGFAAGVNHALGHVMLQSPTDVLLINSDARLVRGCVRALRATLASGADVAAPMLVSGDGCVHSPLSHYQRHVGLLTRRRLPGSLPFITGACMLLSERIIVSDLFDEDFFFYGEDVMLAEELRLAGKTSVVVESGRVFHEGAGSARNGSLFYEYHVNRAHFSLARKLVTSEGSRAIALIGRCLFLPARAIFRSLRAGTSFALQGVCMAWMDVANDRMRSLTFPVAGHGDAEGESP